MTREKLGLQYFQLKAFITKLTKLKNECDFNQTTDLNIATKKDDIMEQSGEFSDHNEDS